MLHNTFYAGVVSWGKTHQTRDPRTGSISRPQHRADLPRVRAKGLHAPLWDEATAERIAEILKERGKAYTGKRTSQLSGMLRCSVCGGRMKAAEYSWVCSRSVRECLRHPRIKFRIALDLVGRELRRAVLAAPAIATVNRPDYGAEILKLAERRARILDAYEQGAIPLADYVSRVDGIEDEITRLQAKASDTSRQEAEARVRQETLTSLRENADYIPSWIIENDPQQTNAILRQLFGGIVVHLEEGAVEFLPARSSVQALTRDKAEALPA